MHFHTCIASIASLSALHFTGAEDSAKASMPAKRIAIIGAGAAGSSTAYHLRKFAQEADTPVQLTVYERSDYVGGRTTTVNIWDRAEHPVELGGSIFVKVNKILYDAAEEFNLSASLHEPEVANAPQLGVWNGEEMVVQVSADGWWDKAKLLWRYGMAPFKVDALMKSTVEKFLKMYDEPVFPFRSLTAAVHEIGLKETTSSTGEQFLKQNNIQQAYSNEIVQASTRVNYAQNLGLIHGLEAMVCMATEGAVAVRGGNWQIFAHMLRTSKGDIKLNTPASRISRQVDGTYNITTTDGAIATFDDVVLAAPLQFSSLVIDPQPRHVPDPIPYVQLHVTLFATPHLLDPAVFNLPAGSVVPEYVLTTLPPDENLGADPHGVGKPGFFSISIVHQALNPHSSPPNRPENIYKIFSPKEVSSEFLARILGHDVPEDLSQVNGHGHGHGDRNGNGNGNISWIHRKLWNSYPYEFPRVTFERLRLDHGLWYTAGIESFISTMETSALMGKNVARLIVDEWGSRGKGVDEDDERLEPFATEEMGWDGVYGGAKDGMQVPLKAKL